MDRYYDPATDQFLSVDPDLAETGQPYAFTGDNPLNATDPLGLDGCDCGDDVPVGAMEEMGMIPGYSGDGTTGSSNASASSSEELSRLFSNGPPKASALRSYAKSQGWTILDEGHGPEIYVDKNGVERMTIKEGSPRTPGSEHDRVSFRNAQNQRINPNGERVTRRSPGNHTPIILDP